MSFESILRNTCIGTRSQVFETARGLGFKLCYPVSRGVRKRYAYRPGATVDSPLVVAHVDTVQNRGDSCHAFELTGTVATSLALDDRLGVSCMFHAIASRLKLSQCAMLLCDDEEIGDSTAQFFREDITPNWLVELDRRGVDVVCYDYESPLFSGLLESQGFTVGRGSFSDISYLGFLGVCGFNMGVGYHREHTLSCHADLKDTRLQLARLQKFLTRFADIRLRWEDSTQCEEWPDYAF